MLLRKNKNKMKKLRLHQFLTRTGLFTSKKELIKAIKDGEIKIEDRITTSPIYQFDPEKETAYWKGKKIETVEDIYIILNKPEGYISSRLTNYDKKMGKKSVFAIIEKDTAIDEKTKNSLFCVGRLDEDTSGLLIITNDGKLCSELTDPKHEVEKTYQVKLEAPLDEATKTKIEQGVVIWLEENGKIIDYKTKPCKIEQIEKDKLRIVLKEGKKREIRRIFEAEENNVLELKRVKIGGLDLENLGLKKSQFIYTDLKTLKEALEKH